MGFIERTVWRLFNTPTRDPFVDRSPTLLSTPSKSSKLDFKLPSGKSSSSSSTSSISSSSTFWMSPGPSRWSLPQYLPRQLRTAASKRQIAVIFCLILTVLFWTTPHPTVWKGRSVYIHVDRPKSNPYQVLQPAPISVQKGVGPYKEQWLKENANDRYAENKPQSFWSSLPPFGQPSPKPRAALISLVRNTELPGLVQSMRQLEYQWNRKYNYPWIFFNDEPFDDEFKVTSPLWGDCSYPTCLADLITRPQLRT